MHWLLLNLGVRGRLSLLVLLLVLPVVGLVVYTAAQQREAAHRLLELNVQRLLHLAARERVQLHESTEYMLETLAQLEAIRAHDDVSCSERFAALLPRYRHYSNLMAATPNGDVFCAAVPLPGPLNIADQPQVQRALATHAFSVSGYTVNRATGTASLTAVYPVLRPNGGVDALVSATFDVGWFKEFAASIELPPAAVFELLDQDGTILSRVPEAPGMVGQVAPEAAMLPSLLASKGPGIERRLESEGIERLFSVARVDGVGGGGDAYLFTSIPVTVVYAEADAALRRNLLGLTLLGAIAVALAIAAGHFLVLRPMQQFLRAVEQVGRGDTSVRVGLGPGRDEVRRLARTFDEMSSALEARERERAALRAALEESEQHYRALVESSADAISLVVGTERVFVNQAFLSIYGLGEAWEAEGQPFDQFVVDDDRAEVRDRLDARLQGRPVPRIGEHRIRRPDGAIRTLETSSTLVSYRGRPAVLTVSRDVTERKAAEEQLRFFASHDPLTGLVNRRWFSEELERAIARAERQQRPGALLFFDMDNFKSVNDTLGHEAGDDVLRQLAVRIQGVLRSTDLLGRMGGDEFIVLAPDTDAAGAEAIAARVLASADEGVWTQSGELVQTSLSMGIALFPQSGAGGRTLLQQADRALRRAKELGRHRIEVYRAEQGVPR